MEEENVLIQYLKEKNLNIDDEENISSDIKDEILDYKKVTFFNDDLKEKNPITNITIIEREKNEESESLQRTSTFTTRENTKTQAINSVAYNYTPQTKDVPINIPGVILPADDESLENDPSNNLLDASGNRFNKTYKKFTYKQIQEEITNNYFDSRTGWSSALDIIGTYLRGQKLIYMESKSYCENKLNRLMMPSIFLSTAATVLSAIVKDFYWGAYLIAGVNGIIAFLLALVNYLKLDAASEAHKITAHQYDKLQTKIEFLSGQTLLFDSNKELIQKELEGVKKKIEEIKETNQFIVPKKIRTLYPIMFNTNVFLIIKRIEDQRKKVITDLTNVKNEIRYFTHLKYIYAYKIPNEYKSRLKPLFRAKRKYINIILFLNTAFSAIDKLFQQEISNAEIKKTHKIAFFLNDIFSTICPLRCKKLFIPIDYVHHDELGGEIIRKIMGLCKDENIFVDDLFELEDFDKNYRNHNPLFFLQFMNDRKDRKSKKNNIDEYNIV